MNRDLTTDMIRPVPQRRIIDKMDEYMSRRDYNGAERHLLYWLEEAKLGGDLQGQLMLRNELVGHYRKTGQKEPAMESAAKALDLLRELDMENTITAGTTYVNIATACGAFGDHERAIRLFEKARAAYESSSQTETQLLGGLYNNMALTCTELGRCEEALALYEKAADLMGRVPDGELEQAITYLNMANTVEVQLGLEAGEQQINALVERAEELLEAKGEELLGKGEAALTDGTDLRAMKQEERARLGYYAFVCEKCAPTFAYYGYFMTAESLTERSEELVRRL
ncbi:MAG: tetratricopeptide repeat protein [Lachnospiraceae bacterium]|nr:tetratricopeptide repeat protein [Lachnospiraceae bacterium]